MDDTTPPQTLRIRLRKDLLAEGYNDRAIGRAIRSGVLQRVRHGAYVDAPAWADLDETARYAVRGRAAVLQSRTPVVLSHVSSLAEWGAPLWGFDLGEVHLTRRDGRTGRREAGVRQHRGRLLTADTADRHGVGVTSPTRAALEATTLGSTEAALCAVNHLLHAGLTDHERLAARYRQVRNTPAAAACGPADAPELVAPMDHWPDTLATDLVLRLSDSRIESVGESRTFHLCFREGLPLPVPQYEIRDGRGRLVARVDFAWPEHRLFLEFDGKVKYTHLRRTGEDVTATVLREKAREQRIVELTGWRCVRLVWADLATPRATADRVRRLLAPATRAS